MTTHSVEVTFTTPTGAHPTETVEINDTNGTTGIQEDEIRAQVEVALRQKMAEKLARGEIVNLPGEITIDSYRFDTDTARAGMQPSPIQTMPSIFRFSVNNTAVDTTQATPYKARITVQGGTTGPDDVPFRSDGQAGLGAGEAWEVVDTLFRRYGITFREYLDNPAILERDDRTKELRDLLGSEVRMGSDGRPNLTVNDLISRARDDTRAGAAGTSAGTDPTAPGDDQTSVVNDFISSPTMENLQKLNRERAKADQLIQMYLAALESGNLDVLTTVMDMVAVKSNLTVAEIAARTARILGQNDEQARQIGRDLAAVNMGATDATTRGRAQQQVQQLQIQLQQNTSARQQIVGMLQTAMSSGEDIRTENRSIREKKNAMDQAGRPR